jgi:ATP-dependent protease Clp ATPase subunit
MGPLRSDQEKSCTFCQKSQNKAKKLIAAPDKLTYICDECTFDSNRLKLVTPKFENQRSSSTSLLSIVSNLFRGNLGSPSQGQLACSFCRKSMSWLDFYKSSLEIEIQAQICGECLDVCRQILTDEAKVRSSPE